MDNTSFNVIESLITSFEYNRSTADMFRLLSECARRLNGYCANHTNDGDIMYGFIILRYGDYGVSPRSGWIDDETLKESISQFLYYKIDCYNRILYEERRENY